MIYPEGMTIAERECFSSYLLQGVRYVEFGVGGSTILAIQREVTKCISVESDPLWISKIRAEPGMSEAEVLGKLQFIYVDIGPVKMHGYPIDTSKKQNWPSYSDCIFSLPHSDVVFIDGRFRIACALQAISILKKEAVLIFHDFWNRPQYHVILPFFEILNRIDTLAILRPKISYCNNDLQLMLAQHKFDVS